MFPGGGRAAFLSSGFSPVTRSYGTGTAATETVPAGATSCTIRVIGGGGSGAHDSVGGGGGAGSAGYALRTISVIGGNTFTYTVGQGGAGQPTDGQNGHDGTNSTVTGTVSGGSVNMTGGFGGAGGAGLNPGLAGSATGGSTNTSGNPGSGITGGASVYGGFGAGSNGRQVSSGTSNAGVVGQVIFEYT